MRDVDDGPVGPVMVSPHGIGPAIDGRKPPTAIEQHLRGVTREAMAREAEYADTTGTDDTRERLLEMLRGG